MKKKSTIIIVMALLFVLLTGVFLVVFLEGTSWGKTGIREVNVSMFSAYTDCEVFQEIPAIKCQNGKISDAVDYGEGNYLINVSGTTTDEYKNYLNLLEDAGFQKHSDNGQDAMEGYVYEAAYTKGNITLVISHAVNKEHTYVSASYDSPLSKYLIFDEDSVKNVDSDAKTKVHMPELHNLGNSFIIQLKNGHFVVHDGGQDIDAPYFYDYLDELTPGNEKPVIEGWFISHSHGDHAGVISQVSKEAKYANRVYVESIYYTIPSKETVAQLATSLDQHGNFVMSRVAGSYKTQSGEATKLYRMHLGQRYYFCDVAIDVALTLEQIPLETYAQKDWNDTSTWLMNHIEGQRFLIAGDSNHTGQRLAINMYEKPYFDLDVFAVIHHGINVYNYFTDYCTNKTVLYTSTRAGSIWNEDRPTALRLDENERLRQSCEEYLTRGDGTLVLTFPYQVGTCEIKEPCDWRYDYGIQAPFQ